ncbi:MAG: ATPase, T2SS/T4P/T4SS family [Nitriliruptorales bacterium]|nr:ATPase, T2SS/T4P/T4SS family [Nitriliruptorales bacterium]
MATAETSNRRMRLGEILVSNDIITEAELEDALAAQASGGERRRLGTTIVELGFCTEQDIADALASQLGLGTVDLAEVAPDAGALARIPRKLADRHHALPLEIDEDGVLVVAMSDPTNVVALDDLKLTAGARSVRPVVAPESELTEALRRAYGTDTSALDMVEGMDEAEVIQVDRSEADDLSTGTGVDAQPIIRLANAILTDAVRARASDIHVEPEREHVRVRYRIDGMLRETMRVPKHIGPSLTSRLKIMASLDIAERRRPQDGRAMIRVDGDEVDLRVSTMPTLFGETIVLRLLRKGAEQLRIDELGMAKDAREEFLNAIGRPQGLIVCTGPTGSGKTTTLYAGMTELADPVRNVLTLEDPIEYQLEGVNQTQINPKIGLTFARGLRTVLRQDPDVVMVGEIRDRETAELAMEASFTGHLVLSTLHTNDAPSTIIRLVDLGIERFLIASSLLMVIAQRLVRTVCQHCVQPRQPQERTLRLLGLSREDIQDRELVAGAGCQICDMTGFLGRVGVYEVLPATPRMRELVTEGASESDIAHLAREVGMRTLREDGLAKAFAGITTLEEVVRTTPEEAIDFDLDTIDPDLVSKVSPKTSDDGAPDPTSKYADPHHGTVLVVDDDPSIRELVGTLLIDDYVVLEAENAEQAIAMQAKHRPDAIVLDMKLPDRDGIEVTREIRESDGRRYVPILMITGLDDPNLEVEGLLAGVDDFLSKPFDPDVLRARLRAAIRRKFAD